MAAKHKTQTVGQLQAEHNDAMARGSNGSNDDGWTDHSRWDFDGFWQPSPGAVLEGTVVDVRAIRAARGGSKLVYIVKLAKACQTVRDGESVQAEPGEVVGIGEAYGLRNLRAIVCSAEHVQIRVVALEKKEIGDGRTMWSFKVLSKGGQTRKHVLDVEAILNDSRFARGETEPAPNPEQGGDDVPFR